MKLLADSYGEERGIREKGMRRSEKGQKRESKQNSCSFSSPFIHAVSVSLLAAMRQQRLSPISPRVPVVEAHPTAMPPDTEPDEEHKATEAYPESSGEHTHIQREASKHKAMHKGEQAHAQSARHVQCTYEHANRQLNTKAGGCTHSLAHVHTDWHSIKNAVNYGPTQAQICWYSLAQQLAITSNM